MAAELDPETLERFRTLSPKEVFEQSRHAVYRAGRVSSEDFMDVYEQLVDAGILTWEQIDAFER